MNKFKKIAKENEEILKNKSYKVNDCLIDINKELTECIRNTTVYLSNDFKELEVVNNKGRYIVNDNIINLGTIDCVLKLRSDGIKGNIIALNFASATTPGGGYLAGSTAQEESLCRASMLYPTLTKNRDYYKYHRLNYTPIYSDNMIYSPNVPIIRDDKGDLLDKIEVASFITAPAVNKRVAKLSLYQDKHINKIMNIRIYKLISLALEYNPEAIVLGAFGCGVFGNDKNEILKIFEDVINKYVQFNDIKIVFAIRDNIKR